MENNKTPHVKFHIIALKFTTEHCCCDGLSSEFFFSVRYLILYEDRRRQSNKSLEIIYFKSGHQN